MKVLEKLKYFFRKYSLFRVLCLLLVVGVFLFVLFLVGYQSKSAPVIESIVPPVGAPGDVITIKGKNFGDERDMGYVSFSGAKLTASCYITWADDLIRIVLPANVQDGLVIVSNHDLQSKPALFVNEVDIPVPVSLAKQISKPVITEISSDTVSIGDLLTITGTNFGEVRNNSRVLFTIDYEKKLNEENITFIQEMVQDRKYLSSLIVPNKTAIERFAKEHDIIYETYEKLLQHDLIQKMIICEPSKRITIEACLEHNWFKQFENDKKTDLMVDQEIINSLKEFQYQNLFQKEIFLLMIL